MPKEQFVFDKFFFSMRINTFKVFFISRKNCKRLNLHKKKIQSRNLRD